MVKMKKFENIEELMTYLKTATPCKWKCPFCRNGCGGIKGHNGGHQCSIHSDRPVSEWGLK